MAARLRNYVRRNYKKKRSKDPLSREKRSLLMSKIRSKNTNLEKIFFKYLRGTIKASFKTHPKNIEGKPDIVFLREKVCVFLDGDFWHGWQFPRWKHQMKNRYWREKIEGNRRRDKRVIKDLRMDGWKVLRLWEHEAYNDTTACIEKIRDILKLALTKIRQ